jgi:hypothetical protein
VVSGLAGILAPDEAEAKKRRRRRKQRHKRRKQPGTRKKGCQARSRVTVCAGQCGAVKNRQTCGKPVDCGSCACPQPCGACQVCQAGPNTVGTCVPDPAQTGDACDDGDRCTTGSVCSAGVCGGGTPVVCPATDCQIPGTCDPATGDCTTVDKPAGTACASQPCGVCNGAGTCVANAACSGTTPVCDGTSCVACSATHPCLSGCCDEATGACVEDCPACHTCEGDVCAPVQDGECCGTGQLCVAGVCTTVVTASLAACGGQCDIGGYPASTEVCGAAVPCPACLSGVCTNSGCFSATRFPNGPHGDGFYCRGDATSDVCSASLECPTPETYCGAPGMVCSSICTGA